MADRLSAHQGHVANMNVNLNSNLPQYDRSAIAQPQPRLVLDTLDPDDELVIPPSGPIRPHNCKFCFVAILAN